MRIPGGLLVAIIASQIAGLAEAQSLRDDRYYYALTGSIDPLYRLNYDEAIRQLSNLSEDFPDHPGPPLAQASAIWLRELFARQELDLDRFIAPGYFTKPSKRKMPEADQERFLELVARSQQLAQTLLEQSPDNIDARYYLGSAEGVIGAFALTIERKKFKALRHGKKAFQLQKGIIEDDPTYYDAYMTVGAYEYVMGSLPWYIKWLAALTGHRGNKTKGFELLIEGAKNGRFTTIDARVLLMILYVRENENEYGLGLARELHHRFPENFFQQPVNLYC